MPNPSAIAFVERNLEIAQERLIHLCRRHRLSPEEAEDFQATAMLKLLERSHRLERQFEGRSNLATYFDSVLSNILRDYRIAKWGKWRSSACAKRLGPLAVSLERLIYRDRLEPRDAVNVLAKKCFPWRRDRPEDLEEELWKIAARLPTRVDRRAIVDSDALEDQLADDLSQVQCEIEGAVQELHTLRTALLGALTELSARQRTVLQLRYAEGLSFAEIEDRTGMRTQSLYRQVARTLRTLRRQVMDSGVSAPEALQAHQAGAGDFCIDRLFEAAGA